MRSGQFWEKDPSGILLSSKVAGYTQGVAPATILKQAFNIDFFAFLYEKFSGYLILRNTSDEYF